MNLREFKWTREPKKFCIQDDKIEITTEPHTDLWQRTYYHFEMTMRLCCRWRRKRNISVLL